MTSKIRSRSSIRSRYAMASSPFIRTRSSSLYCLAQCRIASSTSLYRPYRSPILPVPPRQLPPARPPLATQPAADAAQRRTAAYRYEDTNPARTYSNVSISNPAASVAFSLRRSVGNELDADLGVGAPCHRTLSVQLSGVREQKEKFIGQVGGLLYLETRAGGG